MFGKELIVKYIDSNSQNIKGHGGGCALGLKGQNKAGAQGNIGVETRADISASSSNSTISLSDRFGRNFPYLRLSITDICNFSCDYCLPDGYKKCNKISPLSLNEIRRLIDVFTKLGVNKVRLSGGEPTLRKDFIAIVKMIANNPAIKTLALTTNGYKLAQNAEKWRRAGITNINISIDSLNEQRFFAITGHNRLKEVLLGVEKAIKAGFNRVKINVVLLQNINDGEFTDFLALAKEKPVTIRFIELMQTGENLAYFKKFHISSREIKEQLIATNWIIKKRPFNAGPAQEFIHADYKGSIGIIAPYGKDFCKSCNRLRVSAKGDLHLCLFGKKGIALRHLLQDDEQKEQLSKLICSQLAFKCSSHFLAFGDSGITPHLASIGG